VSDFTLDTKDGDTFTIETKEGDVFTIVCVAAQGPAGPPGTSSGSSSWEIGEVPSGAINGSNATFTSAFDFIPGKVTVYSSGIRLKLGTDFNTSGTRTIQLTFSPSAGESITIDYQR
jgi:hypothetical protein